ncbi:serine hydrolase domain-containing protein [Algoriphagus sp. C2-6-M1]|uniref:serine hydrolase domain-containing protein n=1 Tax=Algoriphagus persicinus TaxID=3108754 RepID=UPI002B3E5A7E|nr:serine hydrolase domain-containing protein [Algoriphagus sp. C2-6-M1]MEB2782848.1 serine hydrolase domain-containing protein [Algoriphagus sp. C2-6-M1]
MKTLTPIFLLLILMGCSTRSEKDKALLTERISRIENGLQPNLQIQGDSIPKYKIEARMKELGIPGVSIAIINEGQLEWAKGYGIADSSENRQVTIETMFLAGSISKPVTAIRAHQLAEEGVISLDSNVNKYLASWKLPENEFTVKEKVTTRRILNHTAGLTVWGFPGYNKGDTIPSIPEVLDGKGNTGSVRVYQVPGVAWQYSGGGYTILQHMITDIEKKSFPELMQSNVLGPLGMSKSTFENPLPAKYHSISATGYMRNGNEVEGKWHIYPEMAAAGLWTTPSQLVLYANEIQQIYQTQQDGLLKANTVNEMLIQGMNDYGLGPAVAEHTFGHNGADEGFRAELIAWKEQPIAAVIMVNSDNGSIIQEIKLSIAQEYGLPGIEPIKRVYHELSTQELQKFTGKYQIPDLGEVEIVIKENGLEHLAPFAPEPIFLLPSSDSTFFNTNGGAYLEFVRNGDVITGLKFYGFEASKIE